MLHFIKYIFAFLTIIAFISCSDHEPKPNIVYIFADDLGYGDIGCFGATDILTPNIDRIANEGIKFTDLYSASSICSPSRAGLLTGRYPQRWGLNGVYFPNSFTGMPSSEVTIAEILKTAGYATGHVGKWHLGHLHDYAPLQQGFDSYFGIPYSNDMENVFYMRDNSVAEYNIDQSHMIKRYTEESINFIEQHKTGPFYLYLAHNMPHVPIYASEDFIGSSDRGLYGDVIQEMDWSVGQIISSLEANNLLENTIIIFSSDNGPWLVMEDHGGSAGELREGKQYTWDGGVKVPSMAMWKGHIPSGQVYNKVISQMDWFPTLSHLASATVPDSLTIDGYNITDVLMGEGEREEDEVLLFGISGQLRAYRHGDYKLKLPYEGFKGAIWRHATPAHDTLLVDVTADPGELINLAQTDRPRLATMYQDMDKALDKLGTIPPSLTHRTPSDDLHYDRLIEKYGADVPYWENISVHKK